MTRSDIAHYAGLEIWGPFGMQELWDLLAPLELSECPAALDIGCGSAGPLLRLAAERGAVVTGIDRSDAAIDAARRAFDAAGVAERATWIESGFDEVTLPSGSFDLILHLGGPYRDDSRDATLALLRDWLKPDGRLVYGDGFWAQEPPPAYLEATGLPADALPMADRYLDAPAAAGLTSTAHFVSTRDGWDHFEDTLLANHEAYAAQHPDDPEVQSMIAKKRAWQDAQRRWGRDTMGFRVDVFAPAR